MSETFSFIPLTDDLAGLINQKANGLYQFLQQFNPECLGQDDEFNHYFKQHHLGYRLFFSIQNSAHILYDSIRLCGKPLDQINAIDYGAGLGTLFLLGGQLGLNRFDYNDHLPDWHHVARNLCTAAGSTIHSYIEGDYQNVTRKATEGGYQYDLVLSRNVLEHIYNPAEFHQVISAHNPEIIIYSTTTANFHNPVMRCYHHYLHRKYENRFYRNQRMLEIKKQFPELDDATALNWARQTRGLGAADFAQAVLQLKNGSTLNPLPDLSTNTCDCSNGVWCEHLLSKKSYRKMIELSGLKMQYTAGYWDTHYKNPAMNLLGKTMNRLIQLLGKENGVWLSPFVNVIALPTKKEGR